MYALSGSFVVAQICPIHLIQISNSIVFRYALPLSYLICVKFLLFTTILIGIEQI